MDDEASVERRAERLALAGFLERTSVDSAGIALFLVPEHVQLYARLRGRSALSAAEERAAQERLAARTQFRRSTDPLAGIRTQVQAAVSKGQLLAAIRAAREAVALAREQGNPVAEGLALASLAEVRAELGNFDSAEDLARMALADQLRSDLAEARARRCLGRLHRRLRQLNRAVDELTLAAGKASRDAEEQVLIYRELAVAQALAGNPDAAAQALDRALRLLADQPTEALRPGVYWAASVVYEAAGSYQDSARAVRIGYRAAAESGHELWLGWLRHRAAHLGLHHHPTGDLRLVRRHARAAVEIFGRINHRYGKAYARLILGEAWLRDNRVSEAVAQLEEASENLLNCGDRWAGAECARLLAIARGTTQESARLLRMASRVFIDLGDEERAGRADRDLTELVGAGTGPRTPGVLSGAPQVAR
jgi:tetratricopeptide (TPR) repeat protein